ncbi:MAG: PIG-L family deacetylase [Caldilineaceae bacterium]|nr:PIG-L family deacetylase [Caldilineaceae bacterium]
MSAKQPILIVAPHPDDETLGCGGLLGIKSKAGEDVHIAVLSDGSMLFAALFGTGTSPSPQEVSALRKKETERTVSFLGGNSNYLHYFDFLDGTLSKQVDAVSDRLASLIDELQPAEIYAPDPYEEHPDHAAANMIAKAALKKSGSDAKLFEYFLKLKRDVRFEDIPGEIMELDLGEFYALKKQALTFFDLHHKIVLPQQTEPLITDNFESYLDRVERFIVGPQA